MRKKSTHSTEYPDFDETKHNEEKMVTVWCCKKRLPWILENKIRIENSEITPRRCEILTRKIKGSQKFALFFRDGYYQFEKISAMKSWVNC